MIVSVLDRMNDDSGNRLIMNENLIDEITWLTKLEFLVL